MKRTQNESFLLPLGGPFFLPTADSLNKLAWLQPSAGVIVVYYFLEVPRSQAIESLSEADQADAHSHLESVVDTLKKRGARVESHVVPCRTACEELYRRTQQAPGSTIVLVQQRGASLPDALDRLQGSLLYLSQR